MIYLRRIVQLLFLALFLFLMLYPEPAKNVIPANLFFISNPLLVITTIIASRTLQLAFLASGLIIIASIFLGRVFCGWACPLGTTMDLFHRLKKPRKPDIQPILPPLRRVKYFVLLTIIIAAIFGANIAGWLDPITIAFKSFALSLYPAVDYILKGLFNKVGLKSFISPLNDIGILDTHSILFHNSIIFFLILTVILLLTFYQTRFWCRNLCPLGALLTLLSKWRILNLSTGRHLCTKCQRCQSSCKTGVFNSDFSLNDEECIQCFSCVKECSKTGISIGFSKDKSVRISILPSRRGLLVASGLAVLSAPLLKRSFGLRLGQSLPRLRPPGVSRSEGEFLSKCQRCGECMKACPTNGLQPLLAESGLYAMFSPVLVPRIGNCRYYCNACGQVCPSHAIPDMDLADKQEWKIGRAYFDTTRCIPYVNKEHCLTCEEFCPVPEKAIEHYVKDGLEYPYVVKERCIGCGLCEKVCPVQGLAAIRVSPPKDAEL
ncbi:MAG: 4Fe-4S binding protein [Planctomycetes bacterium]|nr:4Fe-4S binding protein [Planctomycetota bacterium]